MNELVIPSAPLWYKISVIACAPDNTLVYGRQSNIVIIKEKLEEAAEVKLIEDAHLKPITSIDLNKKWNDPHCYAVSLGEDSIIRVWNIKTFEKKTSNKDHMDHKQPVIGAVFAGEDRVVSAAQDGLIMVWNINTNESKPLKDLFKSKVTLTCLSSCPHASWLLAFGLHNGSVVVADLRRGGKLLYKLRGHYQAIVALSWCPAPVNVFPRSTINQVKNKMRDCDAKSEKSDPLVNLEPVNEADTQKHDSSGAVSDFLQECKDLKLRILGVEVPLVDNPSTKEVVKDQSDDYEDTPHTEIEGRELPTVFDPSGDFLDDSVDVFSHVDLKNTETELKSEQEELARNTHEITEVKENNKIIEGNEKDDNNSESECKDDGDAGDEAQHSRIEAEPVEEEPRIEYLLASSGRDKSVYIWRAGTDGRMQTFFHLPKRNNRRDKTNAAWISLCWVSPDTILTSSTSGQLLAWPIPKPKDAKSQYRVIHSEHTFPLFNIVATRTYASEFNWRDEVSLKVWTWGQDGHLVNYDLSNDKMNLFYSVISGSVTCFDSSVLDPNRLAIGLRTGGIRIWDLSRPHTKIVKMQKCQHKCTNKISTIAWHPVKEMVIAFGTEEGRVGFLELISNKSTLFPHYFHNQVYKVEWGPIDGDSNNLGIYVVVEGKLAIYDAQKPNEDPKLLDVDEKFHVYKFAWKPDFSLLLLNGKDGSLIVLTKDLKTITKLYANEKGLNAIVWHPDALTTDTDSSPRCNWFAVTTAKGLIVYDCGTIDKNDNFADNVVATFDGHLKPTLALSWCPFEGNRIVSVAADGLTHVWDINSKQLISTFVEQYLSHYPVVLWSPIDPDLIILGDRIITVWRISKNPPRNDEEFLNERKRLLAKVAKNDSDKSDRKITVELSKAKPPGRNCVVPVFYVSSDENLSAQIDDMRKLMNNDETMQSMDPLNLFGNKEQVHRLLDANYKQQKADSKHKSCELISLWKGNVSECVQAAITENRVTPSIITLAPMVSSKLWQDACESYAKKLAEDAASDPLETATYFLACHKVEEAINGLCLCSMFKEALALAKHRLPQDSDMIIKVTEKWAEHCVNTGNFENAAFCYISIKQYENAAKVLARRNRPEFLEFAIELAEKVGNKELLQSIQYKSAQDDNKNEDVDNLPSRLDAIMKARQSVSSETAEELVEVSPEDNSTKTCEENEE